MSYQSEPMKMVNTHFTNSNVSLLYNVTFIFTAPSGPPIRVMVNATSSHSISLSWDSPLESQQNGVIRHYLVTIQSIAETVTRNISSAQNRASVSALQPYTVYNCTVQAETIQLGPPSIIVQVSTPQDGK